MSHAGPPSEPPPDPNQGNGEPSGQRDQPDQSGQPDNPYPDNWGTPSSPPPPPPNPYEQSSPYGQPDPYQQQPYGAPQPPDPYGQQAPYAAAGQPGQPGQPNPYAGTASSTKPTFGFGGYAGWFTRVGAYLIDNLILGATLVPLFVGVSVLGANTTTTTNPDGTTTSTYDGSVALPVLLIAISAIAYIAVFVWNICIRQGRTGASVGKSVLAIRLVNSDLQPIGAGWSFLRQILHIVDGICYIGYLWPIWDSRKQTFADKIMSTYVIQATAPPPPAYPPAPEPYRTN